MILFSLFIETFWPVFAYNTVQIAKDAKGVGRWNSVKCYTPWLEPD